MSNILLRLAVRTFSRWRAQILARWQRSNEIRGSEEGHNPMSEQDFMDFVRQASLPEVRETKDLRL